MTWTPAGFSFINVDELGGDEYVRLRMLSRDTAGNWDTAGRPARAEGDGDHPERRHRHPRLRDARRDQRPGRRRRPGETKPIQALNPINVYGKYFSGRQEVMQVNLYMVTDPDGAGTVHVRRVRRQQT